MFAKQKANQGSGQAQLPAPTAGDSGSSRRSVKVASVIADDLTLEGDISGEGEIHVDGVIRGDIRIGKLTLGETGHIEGNVFAESVEVRGRVVGSITAKVVRLLATAHIEGDVTHEQLAIEPGAFFQGRAQKFQRPSAAETADVITLQAAGE